MYCGKNHQQLEFPDFYLPFSGELDPGNRWVALAQLVPWELVERIYHTNLCADFGAPIVPARTALRRTADQGATSPDYPRGS